MSELKYSDLKIGQRVWFNLSDENFPVYIPIIIDGIFPPNIFDDDGYIYGTTDDETREKYKIYFEDIVVEEPEEKHQKATENDLDNSSEILHITKSKFNELLKEAIKKNIRIYTESSMDREGLITTSTDVYFNDELLVNTKRYSY